MKTNNPRNRIASPAPSMKKQSTTPFVSRQSNEQAPFRQTSVRVKKHKITIPDEDAGWIGSDQVQTTQNAVNIKEHHEIQLNGSIYGRELLLR